MKSFIVSIFILLSFNIYAQIDTSKVIFDTVIVEEAPLIIKNTVYLQENASKVNNKWFVRFNWANNSISTQSTLDLNFKGGSLFQFALGRSVKNLGISIGVGYHSFDIRYLNKSKYELKGQKTIQYTDTIDVYYQNVNGIKIAHYTTQLKSKDVSYSYSRDTVLQKNSKLKYIDIPLSLGYFLEKGKVSFYPEFIFNTSLLLSSHNLNENTSLSSFYFSTKIGGGVGYKLSEKIVLSAGYHFQKNISSIVKNTTLNLFSNQFGLDLRYCF